jgi:serine/threonine protein phosphatase PrpC
LNSLGHGGAEVSAYTKAQAHRKFEKKMRGKVKSNEEISEALTQSLLSIDKSLKKKENLIHQGSTACIVYLNDVQGEISLITANVGDSRAVLSRNCIALDLSVDHKPELPSERARIESLGGTVVWNGHTDKVTGLPILNRYGFYRVNGVMSLSRAIGEEVNC